MMDDEYFLMGAVERCKSWHGWNKARANNSKKMKGMMPGENLEQDMYGNSLMYFKKVGSMHYVN